MQCAFCIRPVVLTEVLYPKVGVISVHGHVGTATDQFGEVGPVRFPDNLRSIVYYSVCENTLSAVFRVAAFLFEGDATSYNEKKHTTPVIINPTIAGLHSINSC